MRHGISVESQQRRRFSEDHLRAWQASGSSQAGYSGYRARIEFLEDRVRFLQNQLFGRKSEKRPQESEGRQLELFNEAEPLVIPGHTRRKPKRKPLPEDLPRVEVIHDLKEEEKVCACGAHLSRIGEEVREKLDIVPAKMRVIRHIRYKYACKNLRGCGKRRTDGNDCPASL